MTDVPESHPPPEPTPQTWRDLESWVRQALAISPSLEATLFTAIDAIVARHERLWHIAKQDAMNELVSAFAERLVRAKMEVVAQDRRIGDVTRHFEGVVARLTEKTNRDPQAALMNFVDFTDRLEAFLKFERRSRWCVVGVVDVAGLKAYNDVLGPATGDRIINTVARLLQEQVREGDLLAREGAVDAKQLHGRFGGDEFCFMMPNLPSCQQGYAIADRFREAVSRYQWTALDARLDSRPIRVDVGVVCLKLGPIAERRMAAADLTFNLLARAATLMSTARATVASAAAGARMEIRNGALIDVPPTEAPTVTSLDAHP